MRPFISFSPPFQCRSVRAIDTLFKAVGVRNSPCIKAPTLSNPSVTCLMGRVVMFCLYSATLPSSWVVVRIDLMTSGPILHAIRLNTSRSRSMSPG